MTSEDYSSESYNVFEPVQNPPAQKIKTVEGRLWESFGDLAVTEANIHFMSTLHSMGLATNDVKNFVRKQQKHKRVDGTIDYKVMKSAMKSKLIDAYALAKRLRQQKNIFKTRLSRKYRGDKTKCKHICDNMVMRYRSLKKSELLKAKKRIQFVKEKHELEKSIRTAPEYSENILSGVNIFMDPSIPPESPLEPFVCDNSIKLDANERKILSRGPKFMIREELSSEDFDIEIEKMIAKKNIDAAFNEPSSDDFSEKTVTEHLPDRNDHKQTAATVTNLKLSDFSESIGNTGKNDNFELRWEENACKRVYDAKNNVIDLGNM